VFKHGKDVPSSRASSTTSRSGLSRRRFRCRAGSSIASAVTILIYVLGALLVLRRAGFPIRWISPGFARWGTGLL
jgi:hypothetical protein